MRFRLVKTGRSYRDGQVKDDACDSKASYQAEADAESLSTTYEIGGAGPAEFISVPEDTKPMPTKPSNGGGAPLSALEELFCRVKAWAGDEPKQWQRIHDALLKIYTPRWECTDDRDIIVAWASACTRLTSAHQQLKQLKDLKRPLTSRENISKRYIEADISFYGRLTARMDDRILQALSEDTEATRIIEKAISRETKRDSTDYEAEESSS